MITKPIPYGRQHITDEDIQCHRCLKVGLFNSRAKNKKNLRRLLPLMSAVNML